MIAVLEIEPKPPFTITKKTSVIIEQLHYHYIKMRILYKKNENLGYHVLTSTPLFLSFLFSDTVCSEKVRALFTVSYPPSFPSFFNTLCLSITSTKIIIPLLHPKPKRLHLHLISFIWYFSQTV